MVVLVVPFFGAAVYFLFGEANLGHAVNIRHKQIFNQIHLLDSPALGQLANMDGAVEKEYQSAFHYAASINGFETTLGNRAEVMADAETARTRLIADIDAARSHVHILYYIWLTDDTGTQVANALIRAALRGVSCKVLADGLGARPIIKSNLWDEMKAAGVKVCVALPFHQIFKTILLSRLDIRNHRKITVIDAKITYCGSQNCADPEFRVKPRFAPWVDILLRFEGPVVAQNQLLFASDWMLHGKGTLEDFALDTPCFKDGFPAQVLGDGPTERRHATPQMFMTLMAQAQQCITISTPYFIPDATVLEALCAAAYRGIDLTVIFPAHNDSWIVGAASRSYYRELLEAGVHIFEFDKGLLHAKTFTMDGVITLVGSSNLDLRSFDLNYENDILLSDKNVTRAVLQRQKEYINASHPITLKTINEWPVVRHMWNNVIATLGPVL